MTIAQHLQFNVLTAPLASVDRRGLSQAWYSALYASARKPAPEHKLPQRTMLTRTAPRATHRLPEKSRTEGAARPSHPRVQSEVQQPVPPDRRAARSPLARKIERAFLRPKAAARKAVFELESAAGRVQILLNASGSRMNLIAICPKNASKEVAAALAQARYALGARGIDLSSEVREQRAC